MKPDTEQCYPRTFLLVIDTNLLSLHIKTQVQNAEKRGAAGVLIYTDPSEFAPEGTDNTFPNSWWMPKTGLQRGAASHGVSPGDISTYGYPSVRGIYRKSWKNVLRNKVPAHIISFQDALDIFSRLKGAHFLKISIFYFCPLFTTFHASVHWSQ